MDYEVLYNGLHGSIYGYMEGGEYMPERMQNNIGSVRKYRGLSQQDVADHLGVSLSAYRKWEQGFTSPPITMGLRLARLLDVTIDELFRPGAWDPAIIRDVGELSEEERRMISSFRVLNEQGQRLMVRYGRDLVASRHYEPE